MIYGIGIDICSIDRIEKLNLRFFEKYFSEKEIVYCNGKKESLAGIFAAKEAFVKALGTGFISTDLKSIQILHDENGAPFYSFSNWAEQELLKRSITKVFLSISHDGKIAGAICILERDSMV